MCTHPMCNVNNTQWLVYIHTVRLYISAVFIGSINTGMDMYSTQRCVAMFQKQHCYSTEYEVHEAGDW